MTECGGHGTCSVDSKCVCSDGWKGAGCNESPCPNSCSGKGLCIGGTCKCIQGFAGADCSKQDCPNTNNCTGHGKCNGDTGACVCAAGYKGSDCSKMSCPADCSGDHGVCKDVGGKPTCACLEGWAGIDCAAKGCPKGAAGKQCSGSASGSCKDGVCECNAGYTGVECGTKVCVDPTCSGHGQCVSGTFS
jgi:syndecan 4